MRDIETIKSELAEAKRATSATDRVLRSGPDESVYELRVSEHSAAWRVRHRLTDELREATRGGQTVPDARESGVCHGPGSDLPEVCQSVSSKIA